MKKADLFLIGFILVLFMAFGTSSLEAQTYPCQPVQLVVIMAPGDGSDLTGRAIAEQLGKVLKTNAVVTNKPGGGGTIGVDYVVRGKKDGCNILYINSNLIYTYALNPEMTPYNPFRDLEPLCMAGSVPLLIAVQTESPWKSFQELIDYMKKNPGKVRGSSSGIGSIGHFCYEVIRMETGAGVTMIPYKGAMPGFTALLGGHVEVGIPALSVVSPHLASGKVRALLTSKKIPEHPDIPTLTELGYKRDIPGVWNAVFVPVGVSDSVKKILGSAFEKSIKTPDVVNTMQRIGYLHEYRPGDEFKKSMLEEYMVVKEISQMIGPIAK